MSDDLISRKAVIALIDELGYINVHNHDDFKLNCRVDKIRQGVVELATAFDKGKVKEQIQIFRSKFECTCCPKNIGKHIPVSCDECMDTFAKANIVIVEKGGIE